MDDGEISEGDTPPSPSSDEKLTYGAVFRKMFPYYMYLGMSYDEYWRGDPYLVVYYREAHELKRDEQNQLLWWAGFYNFIAVSTALSNFHLDGKKHKYNNYLTEPLRIRPLTAEEKAAQEQRERDKVIMQLNAFKAAFDARNSEETQDAG